MVEWPVKHNSCKKRNLKLLVQYAGSRYSGWQRQPGQTTIQGALEERLQQILRHPVKLVGASRTDAGVHARGQVASLITTSQLEPDRLRRSLNSLLPHDIGVMEIEVVADDFHALGSARGREYRYEIVNAPVTSPFLHGFAHPVRVPLDLERLRRAAARIIGEHDFTGFADADRGPVRTLRKVQTSEWCKDGDLLTYRVVADGFVKGMIRALVGTFIDVGRDRWGEDRIEKILRERDRSLCGPAAPACGLYLQRVYYA
ncbi:MAG: tRNA pseudouridine(38-40) synthase TruA [Acidobacteriota bacterium]